MSLVRPISRRKFIFLAGAAGAGLAACSRHAPGFDAPSAIEYLERQHGILRRAVFILEEIRGGMDARMDLAPETVLGVVGLARGLMVDYHQKLEENHVYPVFEAAGKMGGLIGILREQHAAGSQLMELLSELAASFSVKEMETRRRLGSVIHQFSRMYRAHADREDTVLFPELRRVITPDAYEEMKGVFRKQEAQYFGANGYLETIRKLESFESALGIGDLSGFTPRMDELR